MFTQVLNRIFSRSIAKVVSTLVARPFAAPYSASAVKFGIPAVCVNRLKIVMRSHDAGWSAR